jgi:hypothetical protein
MTNPDNHADNLNQLLNKIDRIAETGCADPSVLVESADCLREIVEMDSAEAVRQLVDRWIRWIAQDNLQPLVYDTAQRLRTNKDAVLPLVEYFAREDFELTDLLKSIIIQQKIPKDFQSTALGYFVPSLSNKEKIGDVPDQSLVEMSQILLDGLGREIPEIAGLKEEFSRKRWDGKTLTDQIFACLWKSERNRRQLELYRRISSILVHMSDNRFYPDDSKYIEVRRELEKHALPVLAFKLPVRQDPETRWHMALMMGYLGGRTAIDPLVQELIGVEATRASREKMLNEYYLEPARQHSRESSQILASVVQDARSTMRLVRILNVIVFGVGIGLLLNGVMIAIFTIDPWTRLAGALSGLGGLSGVIVELVRNPLDSIQKSLEKLVKTETVFTNFIWELNLNGAYIQSRYVANGILSDVDVEQTVERMKKALELAMNNYSLTDSKEQEISSRRNVFHAFGSAAGSK